MNVRSRLILGGLFRLLGAGWGMFALDVKGPCRFSSLNLSVA